MNGFFDIPSDLQHSWLGLVGLHVLAGLYHYFVRRDGVLQRMLPQRR